jgi:hypothetical protein
METMSAVSKERIVTFSQRAVEAAARAIYDQAETYSVLVDHMNGILAADLAQAALTAALAVDGVALQDWQPIDSAPREWIIGYTSWGQHVGKFHEHVGPCEYVDDHHEFVNIDFDVFPSPTHWQPLPAPPAASDGEEQR